MAEILLGGEPLKSQVELLISIKGVTPLIALAFLADVVDIRRFRTLRKMNAYLGVHYVSASSVSLDRYYQELREKRGTGRARVALIRRLCGMIRRIPLSGEQYRWLDRRLYEQKLRQYERVAKEECVAA